MSDKASSNDGHVRVPLGRVTVILGALLGLIALTTAFKSWMSDNFVTRVEWTAAQAKSDRKLDRLIDVACDDRKNIPRACKEAP